MRDGSFRAQLKDPFLIKYNSRSTYNGIFGFGWCSEFETTLNHKQSTLFDCSKGEVRLEKDQIVSVQGHYEYKNKEGTVFVFDREGRLAKIVGRLGARSEVRRDANGRIQSVTHSSKRKFIFKYDSKSNKVIEITDSQRYRKRFKFMRKYLVEVLDAKKSLHLFQYDESGNLISSKDLAGRISSVTYDSVRDVVTTVKNTKGCIEFYSYRQMNEAPALHYSSQIAEICRGKLARNIRYEFWHRRQAGALMSLEKMRIQEQRKWVEIAFDPKTGLPARVERSQPSLAFEGSLNE